jgi:hypothetical protein
MWVWEKIREHEKHEKSKETERNDCISMSRAHEYANVKIKRIEKESERRKRVMQTLSLCISVRVSF